MHTLLLSLVFIFNLIGSPFVGQGDKSQEEIKFENNQAILNFPDKATFQVKITSPSEIDRVVLEYYIEMVPKGNVIAKGFPDFKPANSLEVKWTWEMLQSGSLPPGAKIHWRWRVTTKNGTEALSPEQSVTWLDSVHPWESVTQGKITLYWYSGEQEFGSELLAAAIIALDNIDQKIGFKAKNPIDIYIYAKNEDFQEAIFYEPGWTGGGAYSNYSIVILGIAPDDLDWGKTSIAHELAHILQGQYNSAGIEEIPQWLGEGIAMYAEGGLNDYSLDVLNTAIQENSLISVQALSGGFSENSDKADLSYSESFSLVNFLIERYGKQKLLDMLTLLSQGTDINTALQKTYGWSDLNGFEDAWRMKIDANPVNSEDATPTPQATPTIIPTIIPLGYGNMEFKQKAVNSPTETSSKATQFFSPLFLFVAIAAITFSVIIVIIMAFFLFIVSRKRKSDHA